MSRHQRITFTYAQYDDRFQEEKPYMIASYLPQLKNDEITNIAFGRAPEELVYDIRGHESAFSLDQNGFQVVYHGFREFDNTSTESIEKKLLPEVTKLLLRHIKGAARVHFFDYRSRVSDCHEQYAEVNDRTQSLLPIHVVHIDQSQNGVEKRVYTEMGDEAGHLLQGRVRLHAIEDEALAVCDASTVDAADLLVADHVTRDYVGETIYPLYDENTRWHYLSDQRVDEILIFKIFDSDESMPARNTPHVSIKLSDVPENPRPRKSFEIRALIFS
ncbi:hypothetical protein F5Y09DRAFT_351341 [Xylaria sp. FL1042]|nr:hypothetical protein F5Y09DRAFT_351341 [Xylaria sp. FL1042]